MLAVYSVRIYIRLLPITHVLICSNIGEDALANLSVERTEAGTITGHVRIRSKTQGIALSLGDRITVGECDWFGVIRLFRPLTSLYLLQLRKITNRLYKHIVDTCLNSRAAFLFYCIVCLNFVLSAGDELLCKFQPAGPVLPAHPLCLDMCLVICDPASFCVNTPSSASLG